MHLLLYFLIAPLVGGVYVALVHRLGALVVGRLPVRLADLLSRPLWRTEWDQARHIDLIRLAANRKRKAAARPVEGELLPRQ